MKVQSIRYHRGQVEVIEIDVPDPGDGEIQLEAAVCGICSWDIATCQQGDTFSFPAPAGHEGVGYVSKLGKGVQGFQEGDRVAFGGFAKRCNVAASKVHTIPDTAIADEYWLVEPVSCAITGLDHCRLQAGQKLVVIGCGFMGLLILQGLSGSYAQDIIVLDVDETRLVRAKALGATEIYRVGDGDQQQLVAYLKSRGIDTVIDTSGQQAGLDMATDIVKRGGLINLFGWLKGDQASFNPSKWHLGGFTVVNSSPASRLRDTFPAAIALIQQGVFDLSALVTHVVSLPDYPALMQAIVAGDRDYLKGVVRL